MIPMWRALVLVAVLGVVGCGSPAGLQYVGNWRGNQAMPGAPAHIASTAGRVDLELKTDGKFTFMRLSLPVEGSWTSDGKVITLKAERSMGNPMAEPMVVTLTPQSDGTLELSDDFSVGRNKVRLSRTQPNAERRRNP
jgi:hypothetical protein